MAPSTQHSVYIRTHTISENIRRFIKLLLFSIKEKSASHIIEKKKEAQDSIDILKQYGFSKLEVSILK